MDDLENKNSSPEENEELEKNGVSPDMPEESESTAELDDKDLLEAQINELAAKLGTKSEEKILKDDVQDWDGLVDDSRQDAEDYILNESSEISEEKLESIEVMEVDEDDERLCSICHKRLKLTADGVTYEYCRRCRGELLDTKYNWKSVVAFILSCVVFVFAVSVSSVAVVNFLGAKKADSYLKSGKMTSAVNAYSVLLAPSLENNSEYAPVTFEDLFKVNAGEKTIKNYIKASYLSGDFSSLKTALQTFFSESDLEKSKNADIKQINDVLDGLDKVGQKASSVVNSLASPLTKEDADKALAELEELKKDESLNPVFLTYYQYYVATMVTDSYELQLKYLDQLKKDAPELKIFYLTAYASTYLYMEQYDKCVEYCDMAIAENKEDFGAVRLKARALTRQKKYDETAALTEEAIKTAKKIYSASTDDESATKTDITYAPGVYLEQAILYGIKGDMKKAQDAADKAYQGQKTLDSIYLYAMLNKKNGNDEAYDEVVSMISQYGMTIPEICEDYINGKKSFEDIFVNGKVAWYE